LTPALAVAAVLCTSVGACLLAWIWPIGRRRRDAWPALVAGIALAAAWALWIGAFGLARGLVVAPMATGGIAMLVAFGNEALGGHDGRRHKSASGASGPR